MREVIAHGRVVTTAAFYFTAVGQAENRNPFEGSEQGTAPATPLRLWYGDSPTAYSTVQTGASGLDTDSDAVR